MNNFIRAAVITVLHLFVIISQGYAQNINFIYPWHLQEYESRTSTLGQSTSVLGHSFGFSANPAAPVENGQITFASFLPSISPYAQSNNSEPPDLYNIHLGLGMERFSFSLSMVFLSSNNQFSNSVGGTNQNIGIKSDFRGRYLRFGSAYKLSDKFNIGLGISNISENFDIVMPGIAERSFESATVMFDLGAYYISKILTDEIVYIPEIGIAISDAFKRNDFVEFYPEGDPFPGQLRLGAGTKVFVNNKYRNRYLLGAGLYAGLTKYLVRADTSGGRNLSITNWLDTVYIRDNSRIIEIPSKDQISLSAGVEMIIWEMVILSAGANGGADYWMIPQRNFGVSLDLYYGSISFSHHSYKENPFYELPESYNAIQLSFRIPFNEQPGRNPWRN